MESTLARIVVATLLTVTVILALGWAALRVMRLLNPIELAHMVESDVRRRLPGLMATERARVDQALERVVTITGQSIPAGLHRYPVPTPVIQDLHSRIQPLLSITAGAIEAGQVDVVEGILTSVTNMMRAYLHERGTSATIDDPLVARVSEDLFSLSQAAQGATSQQVLPEVIRALGRLAAAGVEVSTPGLGLGEENIAAMPLARLSLIAAGNLSNTHASHPRSRPRRSVACSTNCLIRGYQRVPQGALSDN